MPHLVSNRADDRRYFDIAQEMHLRYEEYPIQDLLSIPKEPMPEVTEEDYEALRKVAAKAKEPEMYDPFVRELLIQRYYSH